MSGMSIRKPSPAMTVACVALFVALGGTGYAVTALPKNSIGAAQLKRNSVASSEVRNRSLRAVDFARGQLPAGKQGPAGARGPEGAPNANAANSDRLDGLDSEDLLNKSGGAYNGSTTVGGGCGEATPVSYPVALSRPGRLFVQGSARVVTGNPEHDPTLEVQLRDSSGALVAYSTRAEHNNSGGPISTGGLLFSAAGAGDRPGVIPAGTYTLRLEADVFGPCAGTSTFHDNTLSHVVVDGD